MNISIPLDKLLSLITNRKFTFSFCLWAGVTYALSIGLMMLLIRIAFSGHELTQQAIDSGQRLIIRMANGEIEGKPRNSSPSVGIGDKDSALPKENTVKPQEQGQADKKELSPVPLASLVEQTDKGVLPVAGRNGVLPWKYYSRPYNAKFNHTMVSIVFTTVGLSKSLTEEVLKLPPDITLGFSPYANDTGKLAFRARKDGFESVVDLPMQTEDYPFSDPGSFGLMDDLSPDDNINRMHGILYQFPGFVGMLASVGETLTANKEGIKPYLAELKKRGLLFLYIKTAKNAELEDIARVNQFYALGIDVIIDAEPTKGNIDKQLQALVDLAKKQGYAIAVAHTYPSTTAEIAHWSQSLQEQGVDLVPVSAIGKKIFQ